MAKKTAISMDTLNGLKKMIEIDKLGLNNAIGDG